jgi:hypothetical protein
VPGIKTADNCYGATNKLRRKQGVKETARQQTHRETLVISTQTAKDSKIAINNCIDSRQQTALRRR